MKQLILLFWIISFNSLNAQYRASEWEQRDQWQNTSAILENLEIGPSMQIADIGCHEGYLTMKLSPAVGDDGRIYAVDIEKYKLNKLAKRLKEQTITNVTLVHGDPGDPKLPKGALDRVVILDTYHEIEEYSVVLKHIAQSLKPGGKLLIIEPIAKSRESWARKDQAGKHEISLRYVMRDLEQAGFRVDKKMDPFIDRPSKNDQMWMLVATRPASN